jgi:hypothetical protein
MLQNAAARRSALDVRRLDAFAGRLSGSEQRAVDEALELVLALR